MSPEQMQMSKGVDARSDIWSLGVILFELVTGRPPFDAEAVTELAIKIATQPAPDLRLLAPTATPGLEQVVARCLEKDRTRRYQTVAELAVALQPFGTSASRLSVERVLGTLRQAGHAGPEMPALAATPPLAGPGAPGTSASWGQTGGQHRSGGKAATGLVVGVIAVGLLAAAGITGVVLMRRPPTSAAAIAPSSLASTAAAIATAGATASASAPAGAAPSDTAPVALAPPPAETPTASASSPTAPPPTAPAAIAIHPGAHPSSGHGVAPATAPASPSTKAAAKANCNPPYVIDSAGFRQYKPECL
jgi:serine/threonine-protein kinase